MCVGTSRPQSFHQIHLNYQQGYCLLLLVIAWFITLGSPDYHGDNREESSQCDHVYWLIRNTRTALGSLENSRTECDQREKSEDPATANSSVFPGAELTLGH